VWYVAIVESFSESGVSVVGAPLSRLWRFGLGGGLRRRLRKPRDLATWNQDPGVLADDGDLAGLHLRVQGHMADVQIPARFGYGVALVDIDRISGPLRAAAAIGTLIGSWHDGLTR
jgi:hypothetical protein